MFNPDQNITEFNLREKGISRALYSMNIHQVATPELGAEDARCYILFLGEGSNTSAHIALYLTRSDKRMFYSYSSNPFPQETLSQVEEEARGFAEDMGFVLDEAPLAGMSPMERERWIDDQDIFGNKKKTSEPASAQVASAAPPEPDADGLQQPQNIPAGPPKAAVPEATVVHEIKRQAVPRPEVKTAGRKPEPKQEPQGAPEIVSRDKEALARLLASF